MRDNWGLNPESGIRETKESERDRDIKLTAPVKQLGVMPGKNGTEVKIRKCTTIK